MQETNSAKEMSPGAPETLLGLEAWMNENCFNFNSYSINGNVIHEGYGIDKDESGFLWYYTERGQKSTLKHFQTEEAIVRYAYCEISTDKWARTHLVGFTTDKAEALELAQKLTRLNIEFIQDQVPFYGPGSPAYRTFVLGCDCKRVADLITK